MLPSHSATIIWQTSSLRFSCVKFTVHSLHCAVNQHWSSKKHFRIFDLLQFLIEILTVVFFPSSVWRSSLCRQPCLCWVNGIQLFLTPFQWCIESLLPFVTQRLQDWESSATERYSTITLEINDKGTKPFWCWFNILSSIGIVHDLWLNIL